MNIQGLISFRIGWFDLAIQGDFQESSLTPQFKSINSLVQLSHVYMTPGKTTFDCINLCRQSDTSAF